MYIIERSKTLFGVVLGVICCLAVAIFVFAAKPSDEISLARQNGEAPTVQSDVSDVTVQKVPDSSVIKGEEETVSEQKIGQEEKVAAERAATTVSRGSSLKVRTVPVVEGSDVAISIIREVATSAGCTEQEIEMLKYIAFRESTFRTSAISPSGQCIGLFQLDSNKGTKAQRIDPYWNTARAISYMRERYGNISAAYSFRLTHNWY